MVFGFGSKHFEFADIPDLTGKSSCLPFNVLILNSSPCNLQGQVIIVTGGNAGLGFASARELTRKGAKV
jgi:hypothetical protein